MFSFTIDAYAKAFEVFDEDSSQTLEMGEVRKVLAGLGMSISPEELIKVLAEEEEEARVLKIVKKESDTLDFEEFLTCIKRLRFEIAAQEELLQLLQHCAATERAFRTATPAATGIPPLLPTCPPALRVGAD